MRLVIIGFGNQAKAWALNLRDSNKEVHILARKNGKGFQQALDLGLNVLDFNTANLDSYDTFILLTPDDTHTSILEKLAPRLKNGSKIIYAHGFSYISGDHKAKFPYLGHLLLAPKAIASEVRFQFETGGKLGAVGSLEGSLNPKEDEPFLKELATAIGITSGPYYSNFQQETYADLFSEQTLLCSTLPYSALHSFNKLIQEGIPEELAYFECWYEVKLIADTMVKLGPKKFFELISPNALLGGEKAQKILFDEKFQEKLNKLMDDITDRKFFEEVDQTDISKLKEDVVQFWEKQKLTQVHERLGPELFQ